MQQTFTYNSSNELVRVDDAVVNKTVVYEYDYVGNITSVKTYIYTTGTLGTPITTQNYTYNSQNQRTDLSYDANGNLTALGGYTFGWTNRKLTSATSTDNSISYTYNHDGIRTSKTINGITTYYEVDQNNNVVKQYELVNDVETNVIEFVYDSNNSPIYFTYNNTTYYYEKNLQGDIVAILDANGNTVVEYTYDIWGKLENITGSLADTIGAINPLRYRGYYYDTETNLYYLQSRYYSPDLMRFISQDDPGFSNAQGEPLGSNLYAYCLNNPVMNIDLAGFASSIWSLKNDKFGIQILKWYLYGGGKKRTITSSSWAAYMKANKILKVKVRSILKPLSKKIKTNKTIRIIIKTSMEIENGEDIIGYQYLHGTNAKAGGFVIEAFITKNRRGQTTFCCSYMWNDIIDPNYSYESDSKKAKLAKFVSFGYAKDYYICIIWSDTSVLDSNGKWIRGWLK